MYVGPVNEWVQVGEPEVQRHRGNWVVRQLGYDAATGRRRAKQFGTFASKRAAQARQRALVEGRVGHRCRDGGGVYAAGLAAIERGPGREQHARPVRLGSQATYRSAAGRRAAARPNR